MTGVKKESHQRKPSPPRLRQSPDAITLSKRTRPTADGDCVIPGEVIIEIDMDNDATTDTSRVFDSVSSVSGSALPSASTLSTTESQSPRVSSFSRTNSTLSPFSRIDSSISSVSIMPSPRVASPNITTTVLSPAISSIVTTSKSDSTLLQ